MQALAIMTFHFLRSLASTNISTVLLPSQAAIPSCIFILWRPLLLFPSIFPVVNKCSSFPFLVTWPRHSACLLLMLLISFLVLMMIIKWSALFSAWMYQYPRRPGRSADWQCMLGVVLSGAWHPAGRTDAEWQDDWRWWRLVQHVLQRDWRRQTCTQSCVRRPRANCNWYVVWIILYKKY